MKFKVLGAALLSCALLLGCEDKAPTSVNPAVSVVKVQGKTMGTFYTVTVPGTYEGGEEALRKISEEAFKEVSDAISTFDHNSEIARFNAFASTEPFPISNYLADIIEEGNRQSLMIDGVMDFSVGPLVNLWGFGPEGRPEKVPGDEEIAAVRAFVGHDKYELGRENGQAYLRKVDPRVKLDLSTVGEGLGADLLAKKLDAKKVPSYMIAIAGAIRTKGTNPQGNPWKVGIEDPKGQGVFAAVCPLGDGMSTAGSYRNFFIDKETGKRYSHAIDPRTGKPIDHYTVSVTVIAPLTLITDALDTGLLVLGAKEAVDWGNKTNHAVYAIEMDKNGKAYASYSRAFEPYLKCQIKK